MNVVVADWIFLGDQAACSAQHLSDASGLSERELEELIENGIIEPLDIATEPRSFHLRYIGIASTARRLRDDFELDQNGLMLAMTLMRRIEELHAKMRNLHGVIQHDDYA